MRMERLASPLAARAIKPGFDSAIIHAEGAWLEDILAGHHEFFKKLETRLAHQKITSYITAADSRTSRALLAEPHIHINVSNTPIYGPSVLSAKPTHIWGFWYFDEVGVGWNSSIRLAQFRPDLIDGEKAAFFFNGVTGYMLRENISPLPQEARMHAGLRPAAAVIFTQEIEQRAPRAHYLTTEEMIRTTVKARPGAPIYVKAHPHTSKRALRQIMDICADYPDVHISQASVHDLIAASRVVITQNSGCGFEALMQKKPVITCAKADYWQATLSPRSPDELVEAIQYGPEVMAEFDYEKYFYWFLEKRCLEPAKDNFAARAWARISDKVLF